MRIAEKISGAISRGYGFLKRQQRDWKVTVVRSSSSFFFYRIVFPYVSVYAMALGATGTQLGIINSVGMGVAGLVGPLTGWLIDRAGVKRIYLIGIVLLAVSYLVYGLAQGWVIIIIAMVAYWLGTSTSGHGCTVICANSLASEDRATGMAICEIFAAGILGLAAPMLGALLVTTFGGVNVSGIRPLFFVCLAGTIATFFLILTQLSNRKWGKLGETSLSFFRDLSQIFKQGRNLKRWLLITCVGNLPFAMLLPFVQPFAHEVKGADQYILGAMVFELVPADQMGRWMGIVRFFRMLFAAGAVYLAGVIWDNIGPQYLFLSVIAFDLLIRIPLLIGMPETLGLRVGTEQPE